MKNWIFLLLFFAGSTHAGLIARDYMLPGDAGLTYDQSTGYEWLDLAYTSGMTPDQVIKYASGHGFTIASASDVHSMIYQGVDLIPDTSHPYSTVFSPESTLALCKLLRGPSCVDSKYPTISGYMGFFEIPEHYPEYEPGIIAISLFAIGNWHNGYTVIDANYGMLVDRKTPIGGVFLYRASVPEPSTIAILGLGLAAFAWKRRKT